LEGRKKSWGEEEGAAPKVNKHKEKGNLYLFTSHRQGETNYGGATLGGGQGANLRNSNKKKAKREEEKKRWQPPLGKIKPNEPLTRTVGKGPT